ncbi:hypothetical protein BGZ58_003713 [Dissophora ornata]|nr:hypothetical protein BGZ58_003713 [Dissophora ornata]
MKQQPPALILATALVLLTTFTTVHASLEFNVPDELAIGVETTIEWTGEPSLGISEQSVVLFKNRTPLVALCRGLISGSGQCTFSLNEEDVKTLQQGNEGYHLGLQGMDGVTLDVSNNFAIRSEEAEVKEQVKEQGGENGEDVWDDDEETGVEEEEDKQVEEQGEKQSKESVEDTRVDGEETGEDEDIQVERKKQGMKNDEDVQDVGEEEEEEETRPSTNGTEDTEDTEDEKNENGMKPSHGDEENEDDDIGDGEYDDFKDNNRTDDNDHNDEPKVETEHVREKARKQKEKGQRLERVKMMQDTNQKNQPKGESEGGDGCHGDGQEGAEDAKFPLTEASFATDAVVYFASVTVFSTVPTPTTAIDAPSGIKSANALAATPANALPTAPSIAAAVITTSGSIVSTPTVTKLAAAPKIVLATNDGVKKGETRTDGTITDGEDVKSDSHTANSKNDMKEEEDKMAQTWAQFLESVSALTKNLGSAVSDSFPSIKKMVLEDSSAESELSQSGSDEL